MSSNNPNNVSNNPNNVNTISDKTNELDCMPSPDTQSLQVQKCTSLTVERVYTPGFILSTSQTSGIGSFTPTINISYPSAPNANVSIVEMRTIGSDVCVRNVILDSTGYVTISDYTISDTHMIYAILKTVTIGGNTIQCCTTFDYINCPTSNYILFLVTDIGNIQFLSNPSGAHIWSAPTGQTKTDTTKITPDTISNLPIGDYDYTLKLTNYNDYISTQPITVVKNQTAVIGPIDLVPAEGCIYFKSVPQNARIFLSQVGQTLVDTGLNTPNIICNKPLGDYTYKLTLTGYEDATGTVTLISGHGEIVTKTLRTLPVLSDITISPLNPSVRVNTDQQFSATPLDQYNNPIAATVTWNSSNTYVGIIDQNAGMFSALHTGTSIITAMSGTISRTTTATVTPLVPVLHTITISPATISIIANNATIFTATTLDQFNQPITTTVTWTSSNPAIGTIDQNGVFTAISPGTATITASSGTVNGVAIANVTPAAPVEIPVLTTITISPATISLAAGSINIFTATTLDQSNHPISATVIWDSSDPTVGTINQSGIFSALHTGSTIITASSGNIIGVAAANVTPSVSVEIPVLTRITISPLTTSLIVDNATVFTATTLDQFNQPITTTVTWTSSNPAICTIDQNGVFTAISPGTATITASSGNISGVAVANVTSAPITQPILTKITITPLTLNIAAGSSTILMATTTDQFDHSISTTVTWNSSNPDVGTIDQNGVFTAISQGTTTVTASSGNIGGASLINVIPVPPVPVEILTTITISPQTISIPEGDINIFTVTTLDQFNHLIYSPIIWNSSNTNVGTIDQNGIFTAISQGSTIIRASSGNIIGMAAANVTPSLPIEIPVLTRITISPLTISLIVNSGTVFVASTLDQFGSPIYAIITWNSSNPDIGTIDQNGVFTAISPGTTTITASNNSINGVAIANVTITAPTIQAVLTKIIIEPLITTILVNNNTVFVASTLDQFGNSTATTIAWNSSNPNVGTIDQNGVFSALHTGNTTITASSGNISGVALVNVVKTLPGQPTGGILGNINTASLILGTAVFGAVLTYKGFKEKEIDKQAEITKREIDKAIEIEKIRERTLSKSK